MREMDELFVGEIDGIGEGCYPPGKGGGMPVEYTRWAERGQHQHTIGQGYQGEAVDSACEGILVIIVHARPGGCGQQQSGDQPAIAIAGDLFPYKGAEVKQGCQGQTGEQSVQAGAGGIINITVIGYTKPLLCVYERLDKMVPAPDAKEEGDKEQDGQEQRESFFSVEREAGHDNEGQHCIKLLFDTQ